MFNQSFAVFYAYTYLSLILTNFDDFVFTIKVKMFILERNMNHIIKYTLFYYYYKFNY